MSTTLTNGTHSRNYYFNMDGIRIPSAGFYFDYNKPTVLFIGCSITMGHGLSYEETFEHKLGVLLEGKGYQFINLGVQAYGSDQSLILLKRFLDKFNTKIVIYTFINDHLVRNSINDRRLLNPTAKFIGTKPLFDLNDNNELYLRKLPEKYNDYFNSYLLDLIQIRILPKLGMFPPYSTSLTKAIIKEMNNYCITNNVRFILLNWRNNTSEYNDFGDLNINTIDTLEYLPVNWQENMSIPGDGHPDSKATDYIAGILFKYFTDHDELFR